MTKQHAPGPWRICPTNSGLFIAGSVPGYLAEVRDCSSAFDHKANARLIAASPDLLDALITALPYIETAETDEGYKPGVVANVTKLIRAAIAKAA